MNYDGRECAQIFHVFCFYGGAYWVLTRKNPLHYFRGMPRMWMTAFGTSSSAATLSTTIRTCQKAGISEEAIKYVLPIGCTVNMDGSALERPITVLWIAYVGGHAISPAGQIIVAIISARSSTAD